MSQIIYIDGFASPAEQVNWAVQSELSTTFHSGNLADISPAQGSSVVLVLSALDVSILSAPMPTRNQQKIRQALPFLFEEQLIASAQTLHFAIGALKTQTLQVAVIAKQRMQQWTDALSAANIALAQAVADTQLLASPQHGWAIWCDESIALVRSAGETTFGCDREQLLTLLTALPETQSESASNFNADEQNIQIDHHGELDLFEFNSQLPNMTIRSTPAAERFSFLINQLDSQPTVKPINLLQGDFAQESAGGVHNKLAAIAASVALFLVVGYSSFLWYQNNQLENEYQQLQQQIISLYKETFPNEKRIIDAKVQMQGHLKKLQSESQQTGGLIKYLASVAQVSRNHTNIEFKQFRFHKNNLEIKFETNSLQVVEQFRNAIHNKGLTTKVLSASKDSATVKARIRIGVAS
ncbi:MAG: hypothetical protein JKX83_03585 [Pseudomonadales bacterium]|nr:hypothetical protein [Pseudomonadales bacterium]